MSSEEQWAGVEGLSLYLVSDQGRVMNSRTDRILVTVPSPNGSPVVTLQNDWGKQQCFMVKWLVYRAFVEGHHPARRIQNADGNRADVRLSNLMLADS